MDGKIVLVTGANSGVGFATACWTPRKTNQPDQLRCRGSGAALERQRDALWVGADESVS
jgi:hypothetical protein